MREHENAREAAQMMIKRHGLQAQAIALERVQEMRLQGDAAGLDHWQQIYAAICDLRRSAAQRLGPEEASDHRS